VEFFLFKEEEDKDEDDEDVHMVFEFLWF